MATAAVAPSSEGAIAAATEAVGDPSLALPVDRSALAGALAAQQGFTPPAGSAADQSAISQQALAPQAGTPLPPPRPRIDRTRINAEVQADPTLIPRMATIAKGETSDPQGRRVIAETIANRAIARDQPLSQVMQQYTGPGSAGYYPASTFRNGAMTPEQAQAMQRDVIDPMLRGSDEGTQALGFAPTGNASGGVAARGIASGRYGNAGRLAGETYVTQENPAQLQRLAGARLASLGGEPITAAAAAGNAPIVRPDITPLPRVAQAATAQQPSPFGMGTIPTPLFGRTPSPGVRVFNGPPALPQQEPMNDTEINAIRRQMAAPGDPAVAQIWGPVQQQQAARRAFIDSRNNEAYKAELTDYHAQQAFERTRPKTDLEQAEGERKYREQLPQEQPVSAPGAPSALGTPQSPQRTGSPNIPPTPPGVVPQKWRELQAPQMASAITAYEKAVPAFDESISALQLARSHEGKRLGVGTFSEIAKRTPGTSAYDFGKIMEQIGGRNFLQAYQSLKGGGSITEIEGSKAEAAQARLATAQTKEGFDKALNDFETALRSDLEQVQRKVNRPVTAWRKAGDNESYAPDIGERRGSKIYIGGNPAVPGSWRNAP